jgi:radical SAM protein with 4Fe4S-binding SPASM domain
MPCPFPWRYLVVQWNGDVVPCRRDCNGATVLGNVAGQSLREIWNGPAYAAFRQQMLAADYRNGICGPCMKLYAT